MMSAAFDPGGMTTRATPTILLLFANVRVGEEQYLRNLPGEARRLEQRLGKLGGRVRVIARRNVTRDELFDVLREHGPDTVGLHFGGHAHPEALYIEDDDGRAVELKIEGLAGRLAEMPRLRWVFLNGCATRQQVDAIHRVKPVTVVATERAILDNQAAEFASEFYAHLAAGRTLGESFAAARDRLLSHSGDGIHRFLRPGAARMDDGPPWRLVDPPSRPDGYRARLIEPPLGWWARFRRWLGSDRPTPARDLLQLPEQPPTEQPSHAAEGAPIETLRTHLEAAHSTLVPFFQPEHGTAFIHEVYVDLQIDCSLPSDHPGMPGGEVTEIGPRRLTLERLLAGGDDLPRCGRWALLGDPGAGKSTLARHLVWQNARDHRQPLTLYVGLADFAEFRGDPFAFIQDRVSHGAGEAAEGIADAVRALADHEGRVWLVFDGLDEVAPERLSAVRQQIEAFARRWPRVAIVVCSRPIGYETLAGFSPARVQPLDVRQQRRLLDRWLGEAAAARAFARIEAERALQDAASNPLLLSLMARLASEAPTKALPASRGGLYGAALKLLLTRGHSPAKRGLGRHASSARRLLGLLSVALTEAGGEKWRRVVIEETLDAAIDGHRRAERLLVREWQTVGGLLDRVARDTGILGPHEGEGRRWCYLHRSLRERLAAEALADEGAEAIVARIRAVADDADRLGRWGETLGMACGLLDEPAAPLRALREADEALTLRVLPELSGLQPAVALEVLFGIEPRVVDDNHIWDAEVLHRLAVKWPLDEATVRLMEQVTPDLDLDRLAFVHHALILLDRPPERVAFFAAAGRPVDRVPHIRWVPIPPGAFHMGDPGDAMPVHITEAFEMGATPVTVGQYRAFDPEHRCRGGAEHPVTEVSWWRAWLFAAWVGGGLPTEAQWEHACRAGKASRFWSGDDDADLNRVGWFGGNSGGRSHPVAEKPANPWGLFDMHGNVWEWCRDSPGPYREASAAAPLVDPQGPPTGGVRVLRGGSCIHGAGLCRSAQWNAVRPGDRSRGVGLRLVRPAPVQ